MPTESPNVPQPQLFYTPLRIPFQICDRVNTAKMHIFLICCVQETVVQLVVNIAGLAAPASLFHFDFLLLDVLEGRTQAEGYANTDKASL